MKARLLWLKWAGGPRAHLTVFLSAGLEAYNCEWERVMCVKLSPELFFLPGTISGAGPITLLYSVSPQKLTFSWARPKGKETDRSK